MGLRDKKSLVVPARFVFGALGCVMLGALVYTCLTDGSPFRMDLLYPSVFFLLLFFFCSLFCVLLTHLECDSVLQHLLIYLLGGWWFYWLASTFMLRFYQ